MLMPKMAKGKHMSNMLTNGAMFSTFKRAASPTVRGRSTRKNGVVIYERIFRNESFRELKAEQETNRNFLVESSRNQMGHQRTENVDGVLLQTTFQNIYESFRC